MASSPHPQVSLDAFDTFADYQSVNYDYSAGAAQTANKSQQDTGAFEFYYAPTDVVASHPDLDLFEQELDSLDSSFPPELQMQMLNVVDYSFLRSEMPAYRGPAGPPSSITSGDSASNYRDDESVYSYSQSAYSYHHPSMDLGLELDMHSIRIAKARSEYMPAMTSGTVDPQSFVNVSPVPAFSDYTPSGCSQNSSGGNSPEFYPALEYKAPPSTTAARFSSNETSDEAHDPRRRFKCPSCPRSFARAYNLKTHMATHDPNRAKPHVCTHAGCGRSFSRKHDLGRHLFSIHREGHGSGSVGVDIGTRSWCDVCGRGHVGGKWDCSCRRGGE